MASSEIRTGDGKPIRLRRAVSPALVWGDDSAAPRGCNRAAVASTFVGRPKLLQHRERRDFRRLGRLHEFRAGLAGKGIQQQRELFDRVLTQIDLPPLDQVRRFVVEGDDDLFRILVSRFRKGDGEGGVDRLVTGSKRSAGLPAAA